MGAPVVWLGLAGGLGLTVGWLGMVLLGVDPRVGGSGGWRGLENRSHWILADWRGGFLEKNWPGGRGGERRDGEGLRGCSRGLGMGVDLEVFEQKETEVTESLLRWFSCVGRWMGV